MSDDDLLVDLGVARDRLDSAIERLESGGDRDGDEREAGGRIAPCPECGDEFETLTGKLDHARDVHGIDV